MLTRTQSRYRKNAKTPQGTTSHKRNACASMRNVLRMPHSCVKSAHLRRDFGARITSKRAEFEKAGIAPATGDSCGNERRRCLDDEDQQRNQAKDSGDEKKTRLQSVETHRFNQTMSGF